ncbi:MAG: nuclear transport factor 2 family protein [Hyphomicrobiaceae bacterium]
MTEHEANAFAGEWVAPWNAHDLPRILSHYSDGVVFMSPVARRTVGNGEVRGKVALESYWSKALAARPDLRFELPGVFAGHCSATINDRNRRGQEAAETCELDSTGQVVRSYACYRG